MSEKEKLQLALNALKEIHKWWDISNPMNVVPIIENTGTLPVIRNDSMAANAIINAKLIYEELFDIKIKRN